MTREEQIAAALKVLAPALRSAADRVAARERIDDLLNTMGMRVAYAEAFQQLRSQAKRRALATFAAALRRADVAHRRLTEGLNFVGLDSLNFPVLQPHIATAEELLRAKPLKRGPYRQQLAVKCARDLLTNYDLPVKTTRKGSWHRLAAILFGDKDYDLFRHMRQTRE
jgi:hypothetical protein